MQKQNHFIDVLSQFLKSNNINYQDVFDQFFNIKNNFSNSDEVVNLEDNQSKKDEDIQFINDVENESDYELLINKLNNIQYNLNQLSLELSKNN